MSAFLLAVLVASGAPSPLSVAVFDYARVPPQWLSWAKQEMSRIYGEIGVEISWHDASSDARTNSVDKLQPDTGPLPQAALIVLTLPESQATQERIPQSVIGYSAGTADECRRVAYVLYGRMDQFRLEQAPAIYRAKLLAYLMAHEVGHLLLPVQSHSPSGIMRARWSRADVELAQQGRLRFTADQALSIRSKVSRLAEGGCAVR
jgi:hypothetical protein